MDRRLLIRVFFVCAVLIWSLPLPTFAIERALIRQSKPQILKLFGVPLKGASRDQLRQAFKHNGMRVIREDKNYWVDIYDPTGVLEGASIFEAGYVAANNRFAYAKYTFRSFIDMDTELVRNVINLVKTKYGPPSSLNGNYEVGEVSAKWNLGQGMQIEVYRGWPDLTTYITYKDTSSYNQMLAEMDAVKRARERKKARAQSNAF